jgi:hypothetical protein
MTLIAPHIAAFLQQRLPLERQASPNTCDSYGHAFRLLFEYASNCLKTSPSQLQLEHIDAVLIMNFLNHLEATRGNGAASRNIRLAAVKSFMRYMEYRVPSALWQSEEYSETVVVKLRNRREVGREFFTVSGFQSLDQCVNAGLSDSLRVEQCESFWRMLTQELELSESFDVIPLLIVLKRFRSKAEEFDVDGRFEKTPQDTNRTGA